MKPSVRLIIAAGVMALAGGTSALAQTDALAYHAGDVTSLGVNSTELQITPSSLNVNSFGKLFSVPTTDLPNVTGMPSSAFAPTYYNIYYTAADGQAYAQPLVKTGVTITTGASQGVHDVVFVATAMNSLFAIDAESGTILWKDSFLYNTSGNPNPVNPTIPSGVTSVPGGFGTDVNTPDMNPWIGIVGTPAIDGVNGYIYFICKTREVHNGDQTQPHYVLTLHKVRLADGLDANVVMADTTYVPATSAYTYNISPFVLGNGTGAITVSGESRIYINALRQMVRPGLELYNGRIYIASASHGDNGPYHGWVLTYDAGSLACNGVWNATPNGTEGEGGVWQGGTSVVIDPEGYIYFETGNGAFDGVTSGTTVTGLNANGFPVTGNFADSFVKLELDPTSSQDNQGSNLNGWGLKVVDYFSPYDNHTLDHGDQDVGSGGPIVIPDSAGSTAHLHLLVGSGKEGKVYVIDRDNMGHFGATDNVVQTVTGLVNGYLSVPAFFNGRLYISSGYGGTVASEQFSNATLNTSSEQQSPDQITFPGCSPTITANGTANGVVWVVDKSSSQLRAYDASNMASELWTSNQNASRDSLSNSIKFAVPTPVNGIVYVATADHLVAYGQLSTATSAPAAPSGLTVSNVGATSLTLNWTDNSNNETSFLIERSTDGTNFTRIATVGVNVTSFDDSGLSSQATYYYRVRSANLYNGGTDSAYSNVVSALTLGAGTQSPVYLYHFDEGSGTSTLDSIGGNDGTLIGSSLPTWVTPGRVGSADLNFNGDGTYDESSGPAVQVQTDFSSVLGVTSSIAFWINTTQTGNDTPLQAPAVAGVEVSASSNNVVWGYLDGEGRIGFSIGASAKVVSAAAINNGYWHHVAISRNSSSGVVDVYVDGALSATATLATGSITSSFTLIGALSDLASDGVTFTGANYLNAQLDDVSIYNQVLSASNVAALAIPPAAPTGLTATAASGTELDLSWTDNATNATGYEVWSSTDGGTFTRIAQLTATATAFDATGLLPGTPYSFFVRAVNTAGTSDSNTVNTSTPTPPATPTGATVTYLAPTEVDIVWNDNATTETGYNILRRTGSADFAVIAQLPANSTSYKDTTVSAGTSYDYHIEAYNAAGYSDFTGLTTTTPATSQFQAYLATFFTTAQMNNASISGPTADPDHDGIPNLLEYAFNLNPTLSDTTGMPVVGESNGYLTITFTERNMPTDLIYTVQVSGDLQTWNSGSAYTTQVSSTTLNSVTQTVTVRDNTPLSGATKRFIRVDVTH